MEQQDLTALIEEADRQYKSGQLDRAFSIYEEVIAADPNNAWAYSRMGAIRAQRGAFDEAEAFLNRALEFDPDLPQAHSNLGNLYYSRGDYHAALAKYEAAVKLSPDTPVFHENLHAVYKKLGKMSEAVKALKTAHRLDRANARNEARTMLKGGGLTRRLGCFGSTMIVTLLLTAVLLCLI